MIESVEPDEQGRDVTVRQVMDNAAVSVGGQFADRPLVEARVKQNLGNAYRGLGVPDEPGRGPPDSGSGP